MTFASREMPGFGNASRGQSMVAQVGRDAGDPLVSASAAACQTLMTNGPELVASPEFDAIVHRVDLCTQPASIRYAIRVGKFDFTTEVCYESLPDWRRTASAMGGPQGLRDLVSVVVAWDAMRFLTLGGTTLRLGAGLSCDPYIAAQWTRSFCGQFGEWRFRNKVVYPHNGAPRLTMTKQHHADPSAGQLKYAPIAGPKHLVTNGGGKDTLAGLMLLTEAGVEFDIYEATLPVGGAHFLQQRLLSRVRGSFASDSHSVIRVRVKDDYFTRPDEEFVNAGVKSRFFKTDFAAGHTANYVGFFPIVLHHGYERVWFNVERTADVPAARWNEEPINHQWCKSREYQKISNDLFYHLTRGEWFMGFDSTLRALHDYLIYRLVRLRPENLLTTHSCNYGKPWCRRCPKCCFCYLMTTSILGEDFAMRLVGADRSLFKLPENEFVWASLLRPDLVAWECVPAHGECLLAVSDCLRKGVDHELLRRFAPSPAEADRIRATVSSVAWEDVPSELRAALVSLLQQAGVVSDGHGS